MAPRGGKFDKSATNASAIRLILPDRQLFVNNFVESVWNI
jgi:hypothetical protein